MNLITGGLKDFAQLAGGGIITDLTNYIFLYGTSGTGVSNCTMRQEFAGAGYQVPVGKTLYIRSLRLGYDNASASFSAALDFGYADNDVGQATATAFTNLKSIRPFPFLPSGFTGIDVLLQIPAGKYPAFVCNASTPFLYAVGMLG